MATLKANREKIPSRDYISRDDYSDDYTGPMLSGTTLGDPVGIDPRDALFEQMKSSPGKFIPGTTPTNMTVTPSGGITNIPGLASQIYQQAADALPNNTNMSVAPEAGITNTLNLNAQQVAEQNPELHQMRQIAFGEDYLSDIEKGTGTAQYYSGWGLTPGWAEQEAAAAPVADTAQIPGAVDTLVGGGGQPTGIMAAGAATPVAPPFIETEPNVLTPPTLPGGAPISGPHGDYVITDPMTGDTYAPGDYTDVAGTLADPREKIDTLADTGGRDLPDVRQYADRSFGVDYEALDQEGQAEVDQAYADLYGIDTEVRQPFIDQALDFYQELPTPGGLIVKALRGEDEPKDETIYGDQPVVSGTVFDAEDYGDPSIMDAPDIIEPMAPPTLPGGYELPADQRDLGGPSMPTETLGPPSLTADTADTLTGKQISDRMKQNLQQTDDDVMTRFTFADMGIKPTDTGVTQVASELNKYDPNKTGLDLSITGKEPDEIKYLKRAIEKNRGLLKQDDEFNMLDEKSRKFNEQQLKDNEKKLKNVLDLFGKTAASGLIMTDATYVDDDEDITTPTGIEGPPSIISKPTPTEDTGGWSPGVGGTTTPDPEPSRPSGGWDPGGGRDEPAPSAPTGISGPPSRGGSAGGPPSQGGGGGGGGGCFVKGTPITMADGSAKPVEQVDLGDKIAEGGKVFAAGRFLTEELHDYEGIKVSGSHMVNENGTWVRVRDSEKGKPLGDDEHTVYVFGAENRRILIKGILFTDYFEVKEQDKLATIGDKYFQVWRDHDKILVNLEEQNNAAVLNAN